MACKVFQRIGFIFPEWCKLKIALLNVPDVEIDLFKNPVGGSRL